MVAMIDSKSARTITAIPFMELFADPIFNCRGKISPSDVIDLSRNIEKEGLLQPITIQPYELKSPYRYRIIIGHRRFEAIRLLEWDTVPCVIKEGLSELDALALNLIENINRSDLNAVQEAKALNRFKVAGLTIEETARKINKSKGWVQVRYLLLTLDPLIQNEVAAGLITQEQIKDIASLPTKEMQFDAIKTIKESRMRGEKKALKVKKKKINVLKRRDRDISERREIVGHMLDTIGPNLATRALAWANGDISTLEFYRDIKKYADEKHIKYEIPREILLDFKLFVFNHFCHCDALVRYVWR